VTGRVGRVGRVGAVRVAAVVAGVGALGFGLFRLGSVGAPAFTVLLWLAAVLVLHDGVVAPLAVGVGSGLARLGRRGPRWAAAMPVLGVGVAVGAVLTLLALPALLSPGVPGNPTVLPRGYPGGLAVLLAADVALTALALLIPRTARRHPPRDHEVHRDHEVQP
jgi:hypothetical protein